MNYDEARELRDNESGETRGWHWTTQRDRTIRPAWPCHRYTGDAKPEDLLRGKADPADFETCEPHATREEAERHYYDACLEAVDELTFTDWSGCQVCDEPTKKGLGSKLLSRLFASPTPLCDAHRTREQLAELRPFKPGLQSIHS